MRAFRALDRQDRGQVLVLFAGGLLAFLAIAALVIDLGFVFMTRRQEQNAADPGAIAAARYIRVAGATVADMRRAACFYARLNGFFPGATDDNGCVAGNDPAGTTLAVNYPPSVSGGTYAGRSGFVEVVIGRPQQSFLAQVIGIRTINVSSNAVAAYSDGDSNTSSLIALDPTSCQSLKTHGTGNINIHAVAPGTLGGYVRVNSTCSSGAPDNLCPTGGGQSALDITGGGTMTSPGTFVVGSCKRSGNLVSPLVEGSTPIGDPLLELEPPRIADYPAGRCSATSPPLTPGASGCVFDDAGVTHIDPGVYYGGWDIKKNGAILELGRGVYIIAGGGIKLSNQGSITSVQGGSGAPAPVLIFNTDDPTPAGTRQSNIDFNAQATLKLHAIETGPYRGILVWNDGNGSNPQATIDLEGQSSIDVSGTIYSPKGNVRMEGGSGAGSTAAVQIIAWQVDIGGNSLLDMPYDPSKLYRFDQKGLVH